MSTPDPRTRYGMAAGLLALAVGYAILFNALGSSQLLTYVGAGIVMLGVVSGSASAVADAWYLRDTDVGASVARTLLLVLLLGPIWVLVAFLRRQFGSPRQPAHAEQTS